MQKQEKQQIPIEQQLSFETSNKAGQNKSNLSQFFTQYIQNLGLKDEQNYKIKRRQFFEKIMGKDGFNLKEPSSQLQIRIIDHSLDYQYIELLATYGNCTGSISILNINHQSEFHQINDQFSGSYSSVYRACNHKDQIAIKCTLIKDNFQKTFLNVLKEIIAFKIAQQLKASPLLLNPFGFNMLIYDNCIEFSMEYCDHTLNLQRKLEKDLQEALFQMHALKLIHFDIKPQNICFSPYFQRYVFIDFGLHCIIKQQIGAKTFTLFRGSLLFCSKQLSDSYAKGGGMIDLYYNDSYCLKKTIEEIASKKYDLIVQEEGEKSDPRSLYEFPSFIIIQAKSSLLRLHKQNSNIQLLTVGSDQSLEFTQMEKKFLLDEKKKFQKLNKQQMIIIQSFYKNLYRKCRWNNLALQFSPRELITTNNEIFAQRFKQQFLFFKQKEILEEKQQKQQRRELIISIINKQIFKKDDNLIAGFEQKEVILLRDALAMKVVLEEDNIILLFTKYLQVISFFIKFQQKNKLCEQFMDYLKIKSYFHNKFQQNLKRCYLIIIKWVMKIKKWNDKMPAIIKNILNSMILLQILKEPHLIQFLKNIIAKNGPFLIRFVVFVQIILSLSWISYRYETNYNKFRIMDVVNLEIKNNLQQIKQSISESQKIILELMQFLVSNNPTLDVYERITSFIKDKQRQDLKKGYLSKDYMSQFVLKAHIIISNRYQICNNNKIYNVYFDQEIQNIYPLASLEVSQLKLMSPIYMHVLWHVRSNQSYQMFIQMVREVKHIYEGYSFFQKMYFSKVIKHLDQQQCNIPQLQNYIKYPIQSVSPLVNFQMIFELLPFLQIIFDQLSIEDLSNYLKKVIFQFDYEMHFNELKQIQKLQHFHEHTICEYITNLFMIFDMYIRSCEEEIRGNKELLNLMNRINIFIEDIVCFECKLFSIISFNIIKLRCIDEGYYRQYQDYIFETLMVLLRFQEGRVVEVQLYTIIEKVFLITYPKQSKYDYVALYLYLLKKDIKSQQYCGQFLSTTLLGSLYQKQRIYSIVLLRAWNQERNLYDEIIRCLCKNLSTQIVQQGLQQKIKQFQQNIYQIADKLLDNKEKRNTFIEYNIDHILNTSSKVSFHYYAVYLVFILTFYYEVWKNTNPRIFYYIWSNISYLDKYSKKLVNTYIYPAVILDYFPMIKPKERLLTFFLKKSFALEMDEKDIISCKLDDAYKLRCKKRQKCQPVKVLLQKLMKLKSNVADRL